MKLQTKFTRRLFGWIILVTALFATSLVVVQQRSEAQYRLNLLTSKLDSYNELISKSFDLGHLDSLVSDLPDELRVTIIANDGKVLMDNEAGNVSGMENHDKRPELREARFNKHGVAKRKSATMDRDFLYYATYYDDYYVRTALPYDLELQQKLKSSRVFIYVSITFFLLMALFVYLLTKRYDRMLTQLNKLTKQIADGDYEQDIDVGETELDDVSEQLLRILRQKEDARHKIENAKERLIQHFKLSHIGIALFNMAHSVEYANAHFIQYANLLASSPITDAGELIEDPLMLPIKHFIEDKSEEQHISILIPKGGKTYEVKALKSEYGSFEITIEDITEQEKNRQLKQEMTSNIMHEIRTPLTSIRGYLETLNFMELPEDKQKHFIEKAYDQTLRLSDLMKDIGLLTKLDEPTRAFEFSVVSLHQIVEEVRVAFLTKINEKGDKLQNNLPEDLQVKGNESLLYSIFQNLVENSLRYAGEGIEMVINCYHQDENHLFFSYYDTGKGVDEKQLSRIFERFYRVDEGRTRESGGTGLGLSIVKNSILLHGGEVEARIHSSGGLEILFNLHK